MAKNVMNMMNVKNNVHRSAFDLSHKRAFTAKFGEILPCFVRSVLPGDTFKIRAGNFTRTSPLNTAAYTRLKENFEFFFVPYRLLWDKFPQWITQMKDAKYASSLTGNAIEFTNCPYFLDNDYIDFLNSFQSQITGTPVVDEVGLSWISQHTKLADALGYGALVRMSSIGGEPTPFESTAFSLFPWAAYQKIYQDHFRNSQWENSSAFTYNFDYVLQNNQTYIDVANLSGTSLTNPYLNSLFTLRYANWQKDYFTGLLPSPQFGDEAIAGPVLGLSYRSDSLVNMNNEIPLGPTATNIQVGPRTDGAGVLVRGTANGNWSDAVLRNLRLDSAGFDKSSGISVLAIRQALALQKWKEISQSGSKDYRAQLAKHWNVKVSAAQSDLCQRVGGYSSVINIGEVVNTNLADSSYDADIAGKGTGGDSAEITFNNETNDYGILMGVYYAEPLLDYPVNAGIDRELFKVLPTDFAIPEMDSVGMQETYVGEIDVEGADMSSNGSYFSPIGYAPRYAEYKTARDFVCGGFQYEESYANWVAPMTIPNIQISFPSSGATINYLTFKIRPQLLNPIFLAQVTRANDFKFMTDQLLVNSFFSVGAVRNLSENGLPY